MKCLLIFTLIAHGFAQAQILEQSFPGIQQNFLSNPEFSRFAEILLADAELLPITSSTTLFVPTNLALEGVAGLEDSLKTSRLHRRHFLATHFIEGSTTLGLETVTWLPQARWLQTPRSKWIVAKKVDFSSSAANRVYVVDRPILPYWFDYSNVTTSLQQLNEQTSSLLMAERIYEPVPSDHTFLAPVDAAFPSATLRLLEAFPSLALHLSDRLTFEGILDFDSPATGLIASDSESFTRVERTDHGITFDGRSLATHYMLAQHGLVYSIDKLPSSLISMDFLDAQYTAFPDFRTYFVPTSESLQGSEFSTYMGNVTAFTTHINHFVGYHTTAIPSFWITSLPVQLPMADRGFVNVLPLNGILYIRSSSGFPSRTVALISPNLMVLNKFLTPEWMRRDDVLEYIETIAPHFAPCTSTTTFIAVPQEITIFVPTSLTLESLANKDKEKICRNHYLPYVVDATNQEAVRNEVQARSSGMANVISYSLTKLGVVYQVDRLLMPSPYEAVSDPPVSAVRLFDHSMQ